MWKHYAYSALAILTTGLLAGCSTGEASGESVATARPTVLRYCYSPSSEELETDQTLRLDRLKTYLENRLKLDVELYKTSGGYGVVIEAMRAKKIDVATLGPFGYLIASDKAGAEVIAVRGSKGTGQPTSYNGTIAVAKNSPIRTIEELIANSKDLTFSFVDPASTSGFLVQRAYLQSLGLDPDTAFKKTLFSMNHIASAMTLIAGKVDAAAISSSFLPKLVERGKLHPDDLRILWTSPDLPASPIAVRKDLPTAFKEEIRQALLDIPDRDPELWRLWPKTSGVEDQILLAGYDTMFDGLRKMAKNIKNLSMLEE